MVQQTATMSRVPSRKSGGSVGSYVENADLEDGSQNNLDIKLVIRKRGQAKAKVTRAQKAITAIGSELTAAQAAVYTKSLEGYYSEWYYYHDKVLELVSDEDLYDQLDKCDEFE